MNDTTKQIGKGLVVLLLFGVMLYGVVSAMFPEDPEYEYEYTVKAEQVNENDMVAESEDFDTLSDAEREMLFDAFKKSDHFLGGASVELEYDEPVENIEQNEWKVVRVKGVPILMAIDGPEKREDMTFKGFLGMWGLIIGLFGSLFGLSMAVEGIAKKRKY